MNRRSFLLASLLASTALTSAKAESKIQFVYVGGWDCPYCIEWKKKFKESWLASPEYKRVTYTEIDSPRLKEAYQDRFWPGDLKAIRDQLPKKNGTPRFIVVQDGKVVDNEFGSGDDSWKATYSTIKKLLG